jgi:hypothetical protein
VWRCYYCCFHCGVLSSLHSATAQGAANFDRQVYPIGIRYSERNREFIYAARQMAQMAFRVAWKERSVRIAENIAATSIRADHDLISDNILTFFPGFCLEQNLSRWKSASARKIDGLIEVVSRL